MSSSCAYQDGPVVCGNTHTRPFLPGWRCAHHTPAKLAGRADPRMLSRVPALPEPGTLRPGAGVEAAGRWVICPGCGHPPARHAPGCNLGYRSNMALQADGRMVKNP